MSDFAIRVENLSKSYRLGVTHAGSIRELVGRWTDCLLRRKRGPLAHEIAETHGSAQRIHTDACFWALKNVSFEVQPGEVLGIIGRNGAGKSTVLKILSRITSPTKGRVQIHGRIASLLEVGTGFHPELTGRENVFLNGAILGMTKADIRSKFDAIVAFAEIDAFIDTPVKRYSSGMYVRLAFAVAAHLDPDILIVDEVLAVGDADFQRKCLGKLRDVSSQENRTVLLVSHNLPVIQKLCDKALYLSNGQVVLYADAVTAIEEYHKSGGNHSLLLGRISNLEAAKRWGGNGKARLRSVLLYDPEHPEQSEGPVRQGDIAFCLTISGETRAVKAAGIQITDLYDRKIVNCNTLEHGENLYIEHGDEVHIIVRSLHLRPGRYKVGFWLGDSDEGHIDVVVDEYYLDVLPPIGRQWVSKHDGIFECRFDCKVVKATR